MLEFGRFGDLVIWRSGAGVAFAVLVGLIVLPMRADACSCVDPGPACENYWNVEHVFDGTVIAASETAHTETVAPGREYEFQRRVVTFKVHRVYKGVDAATVEVVTGLGGGDCGYDFKQGVRYVVFAARRSPTDGRIEASICSATAPYAQGGEVVRWLEQLSAASDGATIFGTIVRQDRSMDREKPPPERQPLDGITVVLDGSDRQRRTVSRDGLYEFNRLPPGEYTIRPELPSGWWRPPSAMQASIPDPRACAERNIWTAIDGRLSGFIVDQRGVPASQVRVEAALADADVGSRRLHTSAALTDESGRFEFELIPPGRYVVGVNLRGLPRGPYPRTFFPGVDGDVPAVVSLGPGESVSLGTLTVRARP